MMNHQFQKIYALACAYINLVTHHFNRNHTSVHTASACLTLPATSSDTSESTATASDGLHATAMWSFAVLHRAHM
jgi:hypothetical protein